MALNVKMKLRFHSSAWYAFLYYVIIVVQNTETKDICGEILEGRLVFHSQAGVGLFAILLPLSWPYKCWSLYIQT